jgi:hypothetical protein
MACTGGTARVTRSARALCCPGSSPALRRLAFSEVCLWFEGIDVAVNLETQAFDRHITPIAASPIATSPIATSPIATSPSSLRHCL